MVSYNGTLGLERNLEMVLLLPGVAAEEVLQLTLIATTDNSEGLTLKSATVSNKDGQNIVRSQVQICNGCTINSKINLLNISALNLSHCDLVNVPKEFSALENLKILNLSYNKLSVSPECLENGLKFVEYLDLSHNFLNEFETEPACYKRLKVLLLNDNKLLNIPEWILYVRCFNLEEMDYSFNEVNRLYASQFNVSSNYKLKKLRLQGCYVFERDFKYINAIKTLQYLDVSNDPRKANGNTIKGAKLFEQPAFSRTLQVLKLNYLSLSILSDNVINLTGLRELYLICNNLSWLPERFSSLSNLEVLDVSKNAICYLPADLIKMRNLKKLIAHSNCITYIIDISQMPQLRYLDLYGNSITDFPFNISSLTHVDLEQNCFKTNLAVQPYQDYIKKRQNLRSAATFTDRVNTSIPVPEFESDPDGDSCSSLSDQGEEPLEQVVGEYVEEMWDAPYVSDYVRVCTVSDDEWSGSEPPLVALRKRNSQDMHQPRVSPVFLDAQE